MPTADLHSTLKGRVELPTLKSLFIELRHDDLTLATGTAFLAANDQDSHCALITNRHNVTGRDQTTGRCLDTKHCAVPNNLQVWFHAGEPKMAAWKPITLPLYRADGSPYWIEHPTLGARVDVVALNLAWGDDVTRLPYYMKTDHDRVGMIIYPAEPVSVIGFPFGLSSSARFPIWATGFLAQELDLVEEGEPSFLIDCRTRKGQSGSPVIAYRPSGYRLLENGRIVAHMSHSKTWEFLGIYSGRINAESDLGRVWHVQAIQDVLGAAERDFARRCIGMVPNLPPAAE